MSMNPQAEDFERLAIRWADAPHSAQDFPNVIAAIAAFPELYAKNRDALPQNDADRAFGLVARACQLLDRGVNMAPTDEAAAKCTDEAAGLIGEALKLDPTCYDAVRIRRYLTRPTRDEMVAFLTESADEVREMCLATARKNGLEAPAGRWSLSVYQRPYLRWLFDLANEQLSCGRYRCSLEICRQLLELDEPDLVGARHVAAFDYVKLEDAEGLAALMARYPDDTNAWFLLSRCFLAYKQRRLDDAAALLHQIVRTYDRAGYTLAYQDELPAGVFGHLEYAEGTADELYIAVSEAAVILDENCGDFVSPLSDWIARDPVVEQARARDEAADARENAAASGAQPVSAPQPTFASQPPSGSDAVSGGGFDDVTSVDDLLEALRAAEGGTDAPAGATPGSASGTDAGPASSDGPSSDPCEKGR